MGQGLYPDPNQKLLLMTLVRFVVVFNFKVKLRCVFRNHFLFQKGRDMGTTDRCIFVCLFVWGSAGEILVLSIHWLCGSEPCALIFLCFFNAPMKSGVKSLPGELLGKLYSLVHVIILNTIVNAHFRNPLQTSLGQFSPPCLGERGMHTDRHAGLHQHRQTYWTSPAWVSRKWFLSW